MKSIIYILFLFTLLIGHSQNAYESITGIPKTTTSAMNLQGDIARISLRVYSSDKVMGALNNGVTHYQFANNKLQSEHLERYNEVHFYSYKNEKLDSITIRVNGKFHSSKVVNYHGDAAEMQNTASDTPFSKFTTNSKGQIILVNDLVTKKTITRTYTDFEGLIFVKQQEDVFNAETSLSFSIKITNTHKKGTWLGLPVIVQTSKKEHSEVDFITTITRYYNTRGDLVFEEVSTPKMTAPNTYETFYKYDVRGNWVSAITFNISSGKITKYHERRILYTDNLVSGNTDFVENYVLRTYYPEMPNQYAYKYDVAKKLFWFKDPSGNVLTKSDWKYMGNFNTNHAYYIDKTTGMLIEFTDYSLIKEGDLQYHKARNVSGNLDDYIFNINKTFYIFMDGQFQNVNDGHLVREKLSANQQSYYNTKTNQLYQFSTPCKENICPLIPMPYSKERAHYFLFKNHLGSVDCTPFHNGKLTDIKEHKSIYGGNTSYLEFNGQYFEYDLTKTPLNTFYPAKVISKAKFDEVLANSENLVGDIYATAEGVAKINQNNKQQPSAQQPAQPQSIESTPKRTEDMFNCKNNVPCLEHVVASSYRIAKEKNKTDEEAAKSQVEVINHLYSYNPKLAYEVIMAIKGDQLFKLLAELSPEQRKYFREQSKKTVDDYVKKHGAPKIKTVPYKGN